MKTSPTVSVVIPTRDRHELLREAVDSISRQSLPNIELLIIDDCSVFPVDLATLSRPAMLLRHHRSQGPGAARNTGLAVAQGEFIFFLDDDDWITDDRLQVGVESIGDFNMHATPLVQATADGCRPVEGRRFEGDMRATLHRGVLPQIGQVLFRRADCVQFDPSLRLMEDVEWWIRMWDRATFSWTETPGLFFRQHPEARVDVNVGTRPNARRAVVSRHKTPLAKDPPSYAYHLRRAGSAAYLAGQRWSAGILALRSLAAAPSRSSVGLLARCAVPFTLPRDRPK